MDKINIPAKDKVASFDVDAQYTFTPACPDELPVPGGEDIVDELNAQAKYAVIRIGSKDAHSPKAVWVANEKQPVFSRIEAEQADLAWPVHAVPGTKGFELIKGLPKITEYDYFVWKGVEPDIHPYGACYHDLHERMSTGVIEFLRSHEISTVIVGGLATDYCVRATVLQLLKAKFQVIVNLGACRGVAENTTKKAIDEMKSAGAVLVGSNLDLLLLKNMK